MMAKIIAVPIDDGVTYALQALDLIPKKKGEA